MLPMLIRSNIAAILVSAAVSSYATGPIHESKFTVPVRIHLLQSSNQPQVHTTLAEADVRRVLQKVNRVWSAAGIAFEIQSITREAAHAAEVPEENAKDRWLRNVTPPETRATNAFNIYYVK